MAIPLYLNPPDLVTFLQFSFALFPVLPIAGQPELHTVLQMWSYSYLVLLELHSTGTGLLAQFAYASHDAPSTLVPFAPVWPISLETFAIHVPVQN